MNNSVYYLFIHSFIIIFICLFIYLEHILTSQWDFIFVLNSYWMILETERKKC